MAIRMSTEVTSKGSSNSWKRTWLRSWVVVMPSLNAATPNPRALRITMVMTLSTATTEGKPRCSTAEGALFSSGVEQHDHEGEQHHDGARIHDDLRGGQELRAQKKVKDGQGGHDNNERQCTVDGVALEEEVDGSSQTEARKK
jgi:hypothetical protein